MNPFLIKAYGGSEGCAGYHFTGGFGSSPLQPYHVKNVSPIQTGDGETTAQGVLPLFWSKAQVKTLLKEEGKDSLSIVKSQKKGN